MTTSSPAWSRRSRINRLASLSTSFRATASFLRRHLYTVPVLLALVLSLVGWWVRATVEKGMRHQTANELNTILDANVTALEVWMHEQEVNAESLAVAEGLPGPVQELVALSKTSETPESALSQSKALAELRRYLHPRVKICGYTDFFVVSPEGMVIAANQDAPIGKRLGGYREAFFEQVLLGKPSVSKPYRAPLLLPDENGELRAELPTMFTASAIWLPGGKSLGVLGLRIRPEAEFTRVLRSGVMGDSGETYAFDGDGMLLSQSRHDQALKEMGLLADLPNSHSVLTVELRDPGVDMTQGGRPSKKRSEQPLTFLAANATGFNAGTDVEGHRDYRGVPVVAAWRWLPTYNFGVGTQVDAAEAFAPLRVIRMAMWGLFALLAVSAGIMFFFMVVTARQGEQLHQAVLAAQQLGQYTLEEKLGEGGMGAVYRGRHALLRRPTAIKMISGANITDNALARFEREVQITSQLNHPNTIAIYDYGRTPDGVFFYAMEYLEGINLQDLVDQFGPLPEGRVIHILRQVCGSLAEAHGMGLIHRDIKPANIVLNCRGGIADFVKVLDFGLVKAVGGSGSEARLTKSDAMIGTPLYLSPEAIDRPADVDLRTDIYAIGAVGYFLVTGKPVFDGDSVMDVCLHHLRSTPQLASKRVDRPISDRFEAILMRCLAKNPDERPATARALCEELEQCDTAGTWSAADAEAWWKAMHTRLPSNRHVAPSTAAPGLAPTLMVEAQPRSHSGTSD
jgi:hypothetical protein